MSDEDMAVDQEQADVEMTDERSDADVAQAKLKEAISVHREEIGALRIKLTVTIPQNALDERRDEQFAELKRDSLVPGFRKGHAPLKLVEKRFASDVGEQLKTQVISSGYLAAVEKEEIDPLGDPLFLVTVEEERVGDDQVAKKVETEKLLPLDQALDSVTIPTQGPLIFQCEVELKPDFELPELKKIPVKRPKVSIDDDDVDAEVTRLCMWRGTFQPVEDGDIEADDMLYVDLKMTVDDDVIATEDNFDVAARGLRIKGVPIEAFGDAVIGKKSGDKAMVEAFVPDDHENVDIRGKTARFDMVIREIKRFEPPTIDDELLSAMGFESEDDMRAQVRGSLESRLDATIKDALRQQIGEYLAEKTAFDIPEGLSQRQTDRSVQRRRIEMYQAGMPESEIDKNMDELRAKAHDQAVHDLRLFFILAKIADEADIEVSEEQLNGAIAQVAQRTNKRFDRVRDELSKSDGLMVLYHQLRDQKVLDSLLEDAEVTEEEGPKKKKPDPKTKKKAAVKKTEAKEPVAKKPVAKEAVAKKPAAKKKTTKKKAAKRSS